MIQDIIDGRMKTSRAAEHLGISPRQCRRLIARYRNEGPLGVTSKRTGQPSNNQLPLGMSEYEISIIREHYSDFGPTLACEKLSEVHGVYLSKETVRKLMIQANLWIPRQQRAPKIQQPRYRRPCVGELVQYVDDATSRLMQLLFVKSESTFTYFEATRGYIEKHGKPLSLYSDEASIFRINNKNATGGDGITQFGRAMNELNISTICAETSSAKGRVERAHLTLQDRLVKEFRLQGISSIQDANSYAEIFMADYNRRFAKVPRHDFDVHRPLEADDDLNAFFTWREPRRVSKSLTVQYDKVLYLIEDNELSRRAIGRYIEVWHYPDERKELRLNGVSLPYSTYDHLSKIDQGAIVDNKRLGQTLEFIQLVQNNRDNNRSQSAPSGNGPSRRKNAAKTKKSQRSLNGNDMLNALTELQSRSTERFSFRMTI
ncbi:transposase [Tatumella morbirosei]|uniref:Transposase n=1 Tax=Tatumella morbirosei TaxID=642227 RepID=A0A095UF33_9GAMM|nr:ISNCY family transposase [Tatumella morbirosei]KGD73043.1 transposase [Tatumella morbirosei]